MSEEKYLGRKVKEKHKFLGEGTFESYNLAQAWCAENGYDEGSLCSPMPVGIMKGEYNLPWKWKNMSKKERQMVDGVIVTNTGTFREGEITIYIFN